MPQETGMVRAPALPAALTRSFLGLPACPRLLGGIFFSLLFLLAGIAVAADGAKPEGVTRVSVTKPSIKTKDTSVKPVVCAPKPDGDAKASPASGAASSTNAKSGTNKDASGAAGSDLSMRLPPGEESEKHEESEKNNGSAASSPSQEASENAMGDSSGMKVRLKDKEIDSAPPASPAQCTVPQADQPPVPH